MGVDLRQKYGGAWECGWHPAVRENPGADARGERRAEISSGTFVISPDDVGFSSERTIMCTLRFLPLHMQFFFQRFFFFLK